MDIIDSADRTDAASAQDASDAAATTKAGEGAQQLLQIRLTFAVEWWPGGGANLYGASQGVFLALLRIGDSSVATALHDGRERKRFALSPLRITPLSNSDNHIAQAEVTIGLWDMRLALALGKAISAAQYLSLDIAAHPARLLDCEIHEQTSFASLLDPPRARSHAQLSQTIQWVRFTTPTVFSWGRGVDGRHRYGLLPTPEHVVGSWLRAWNAGGGPPLPFESADDWLRERIRIHTVRSLRTAQAHTGKTPITGFIGEVAFEWCGAIPGGHRALRSLAAFARFCGTGSKTAYGLGQTEIGANQA